MAITFLLTLGFALDPRRDNSLWVVYLRGIASVTPSLATPSITAFPPLPHIFRACMMVPGAPDASTATETPSPPVSCRTASTGSHFEKSTTSSAPNSLAVLRRGFLPTTMTLAAPMALASFIAIMPMGPGPMTATMLPGTIPDSSRPCSATPAVSHIAASL